MTHPGQHSKDEQDPLYQHRQEELAYFLSEGYLNDLAAHHCQLKAKDAL